MATGNEEWRPIPGFRGRYIVSSRGRVARVLNGYVGKTGYRCVSLSEKCKSVLIGAHQLVARAFLGPANGMWVHHKDNDKTNNAPWNLEYVTPKENTRRAFADGIIGVGENHHAAKLTLEQVEEIRDLCAAGSLSQREIGLKFNVSTGTISDIHLGKNWKGKRVRVQV